MPSPCDRTSKLLLYKQGWCSSRCCAKTLGADYPHTASLSQGICAFAGVPPRGLSPTPSACFLTIPQQKHFSKLLISASLEKWKCPCVASLGFLWFQWVLSVSVFYQPEGKCAETHVGDQDTLVGMRHCVVRKGPWPAGSSAKAPSSSTHVHGLSYLHIVTCRLHTPNH